jgi:hypothetical protein
MKVLMQERRITGRKKKVSKGTSEQIALGKQRWKSSGPHIHGKLIV